MMSDLAAAFDFVADCHTRGMGGVLHTPCQRAEALSELTGCDIRVKLENLQATGSFKERGAYAKLVSLSPAERSRGVVAASAGNHAQGVARHGRLLGIETVIFMPLGTPAIKVNATRALGAKVELAGADFDETSQLARDFCAAEGRVLVHPFDDPLVMAGQGTVAAEMLADQGDIDVIVVPIGGGGLASGIALTAKRIRPEIEIIGVQADLFPSFHNLFHSGARPVGGMTLAEGIAVREPGTLTRRVMTEMLDDVLLVDERTIERALNLYLTRLRVLPEGAGAAGLAAVLAHPERFAGKVVGLVLTGGNIDTRLLSSLLLRDLARSRRLARLRIELIDVPGQLSSVSQIISEAGGNVTDVAYHKTFSDLPAKVTYIDISLEAQDAAHMDRVHAALREAGFRAELAGY
ncbi:threonine ammonia-lyase [Maricaulis sp.]|uniref:threonine ammonia-lyase n=1 Tax=Maricaulis sp. TaxID=1486257 RepID=UPI003A8E1280